MFNSHCVLLLELQILMSAILTTVTLYAVNTHWNDDLHRIEQVYA